MRAQSESIEWQDWLALRPDLVRVLGRHCVDENEVDDIVQETYLRVALYGRKAPSGSRLRSWMIRIAMNALADWKNRSVRYVQSVSEGPDPEQVPDEEEQLLGEEDLRVGRYRLGEADAIGLMRRTWPELRSPDRELLDSVYTAGNDRLATAQRCGIPEHLVKGHLYRARQRLCRAMRHRAALEHGA